MTEHLYKYSQFPQMAELLGYVLVAYPREEKREKQDIIWCSENLSKLPIASLVQRVEDTDLGKPVDYYFIMMDSSRWEAYNDSFYFLNEEDAILFKLAVG